MNRVELLIPVLSLLIGDEESSRATEDIKMWIEHVREIASFSPGHEGIFNRYPLHDPSPTYKALKEGERGFTCSTQGYGPFLSRDGSAGDSTLKARSRSTFLFCSRNS